MVSNKIEFGVTNCHWCEVNFDTENGFTYKGSPIPFPGAVKLVLNPKEESESAIGGKGLEITRFYKNMGIYEGELEVTSIPTEFYSVLREKVDANGAIYEDIDMLNTEPKYFALLGQFEGSETPTRFVFYKVIASKPAFEYKTKDKKINASNKTIPITALPRIFDGMVKAKFEQYRNPFVYKTWFDKVYTIV